jgi:hypothetical protein
VVRVPWLEAEAPSRTANRLFAIAWARVVPCPVEVVTPSLETRPGPHSAGRLFRAAVQCVSVTDAMSSAPDARAVAERAAGRLFGATVAERGR